METMEWAKQSEEMLKTWTDAQKKVWDDCMKALQGFGKSPSTQVWEKTVDTWNQTIQKSLDAQVEGARHWVKNFTTAKGTPEETAEWAKQGQEMITRLMETQKQLWETWFELVKKLDVSNMMNWTRDGQKFTVHWTDPGEFSQYRDRVQATRT
jgi:hypothetical protein